MTPARARILRAELATERQGIARALEEIATLLSLAKDQPAREHVYALALMLHGLYNGIERIFVRVATDFDGGVPGGSDSHRRLLDAMAIAVPDTRPAVISAGTREALRPLMTLRHAVRHLYFFDLRWDALARQATDAPGVVTMLERDAVGFDAFLEKLGSD